VLRRQKRMLRKQPRRSTQDYTRSKEPHCYQLKRLQLK
jgi:hypothetical protein